MSREHEMLINRARTKFGAIYPCGNHDSLSSCFARQGDQLLFWFNTGDGSTHLEVKSLESLFHDHVNRQLGCR